MEQRVGEAEAPGESVRSVATEANAGGLGFPHTPRGRMSPTITSERRRSFTVDAVNVQDLATAASRLADIELAQRLVSVEHFVDV